MHASLLIFNYINKLWNKEIKLIYLNELKLKSNEFWNWIQENSTEFKGNLLNSTKIEVNSLDVISINKYN